MGGRGALGLGVVGVCWIVGVWANRRPVALRHDVSMWAARARDSWYMWYCGVFKARLTDQNTHVVPFLLKLVLTLRPALRRENSLLKNSGLRAPPFSNRPSWADCGVFIHSLTGL
jgi:hypothetical protein